MQPACALEYNNDILLTPPTRQNSRVSLESPRLVVVPISYLIDIRTAKCLE